MVLFSAPHEKSSMSWVSKCQQAKTSPSPIFVKKKKNTAFWNMVKGSRIHHCSIKITVSWRHLRINIYRKRLLCTSLICLKADLLKEFHCYKSLIRDASLTRGKEWLLSPEMRSQCQDKKLHKQTLLNQTLPSTAAAAAKSLQSCPTLCDPIDGSPPGSPVPGILQARTLEWVAISFSLPSNSFSHIFLTHFPPFIFLEILTRSPFKMAYKGYV